jgi:hypothetical protein
VTTKPLWQFGIRLIGVEQPGAFKMFPRLFDSNGKELPQPKINLFDLLWEAWRAAEEQ